MIVLNHPIHKGACNCDNDDEKQRGAQPEND